MLLNTLNFNDVGRSKNKINSEKVSKLFEKIFSKKQLLLIEKSFEYDEMTVENTLASELSSKELKLSYDEEKKCKKFRYRYFSDEKCLTAIMNNIIKNGEFIP